MDDVVILRDSASSVGGASSVGAVGVSGPTVMAQAEVVRDLVHAYGVMDRPSYQQLVGIVTTQLRVMERTVSLQCGSLRVSSGQSATSGSISGSSARAGAVSERKSKLASIRRASSWRTKTLPQGLCYLGMLRDSDAQHVGERLGQWPTLASLLKTPASSFKSLHDLDSFRLSGDDCAAHVAPFGDGTGLLPSFARVAQGLKLAPGTFGAVLRASAVQPDPSALRVTARTPVGGSGSGSGVSALGCSEPLGVVSGLVPDGFCYLKMFRPAVEHRNIVNVGPHPTLSTLVGLSASEFQSFEQLSRFRFVSLGGSSGVSRVHVVVGGSRGDSVLSVVRSYVDRVGASPGTFGAAVKAASGSFPVVYGYEGSCVVGGGRDLSDGNSRAQLVSELSEGDRFYYDRIMREYRVSPQAGRAACLADLDRLGKTNALTYIILGHYLETEDKFSEGVLTFFSPDYSCS